jgi:DNA polymerase-3 subunit gamma/tau
MAYTVLARKYRSRTFDEIAGQDAIATTLKHAVASGRIHHGYLFTGTRGVGKTSMARILAKSLNCLAADAPTPDPCCKCEACLRIAEGEDIDVIEIDAASNTGVDNIRELRSNAVYRPARSRFKIYIIDEVHMLSTGAFNALLKTLEEPPEHVKFILATTEAHRVPATIQSRCQRFDFKSIDADTIAAQLRRLLKAEGVEADDRAIRRVARLAAGSMRDALSLLDQLMAFSGSSLTGEMVDQVLPPAHDEQIYELVDQIANRNAAEALRAVERCLSSGHTVERLCEALIDYLRTLTLLRVCGEDTDLVDVGTQVRAQLAEQAKRFSPATYVYMISLCEEVRRAVKASRAGRALLDAAVVRLAAAEQFADVETILSRLEQRPAPASPPDAVRKKKDARPATPLTPAPPTPRSDAAEPAFRRSAPSVERGPVSGPAVRTADKQAVLADPLVQHALKLTAGTVARVRVPANSSPWPMANKRGEPNTDPEDLSSVAEGSDNPGPRA